MVIIDIIIIQIEIDLDLIVVEEDLEIEVDQIVIMIIEDILLILRWETQTLIQIVIIIEEIQDDVEEEDSDIGIMEIGEIEVIQEILGDIIIITILVIDLDIINDNKLDNNQYEYLMNLIIL